ncbi:tubulin binding cofactor A [Parasitella parasitica]|nr:tubulin binding cofactor A [Parasitella parasitica]
MSLTPLKIKTNVLKRINREYYGYLKEAVTQQKRIDKLIEENADEADISKQKEVLAETHQMIPDVKKRLAAAQQDLQNLVDNTESGDANELQEARTVLSDVESTHLNE